MAESYRLPFADKLNEFFYEGLDRETSVRVYGSAATGNWVSGRSDLDLVVLVPNEKLDALGHKLRTWASASSLKYPIVDGYALTPSGNGYYAIKRLDDFVKVRFPSDTRIDLIDKWIIKNRSKHLFGTDSILKLFPDIDRNQLSAWAREQLRNLSIVSSDRLLPEPRVVFSGLIWSTSWAARMLMLSRGILCESKKDALEWLANEHTEIRNSVRLLLNDYSKTDEEHTSITPDESATLRRFCLGLLLGERAKAVEL